MIFVVRSVTLFYELSLSSLPQDRIRRRKLIMIGGSGCLFAMLIVAVLVGLYLKRLGAEFFEGLGRGRHDL